VKLIYDAGTDVSAEIAWIVLLCRRIESV